MAISKQNILESIILPFTKQREPYLYENITNPSFVEEFPQACWFSEVFNATFENYQGLINEWLQTHEDDIKLHMVRNIVSSTLKRKLRLTTLNLDPDFIVALSGEVQESKEPKEMYLALIPEDEMIPHSKMIISFEQADQRALKIEHAHAVRKQLDLAKKGVLAASRDPITGWFRTIGVMSIETSSQYMRFRINRLLNWDFILPNNNNGICVLRYEHGAYMMPYINLSANYKKTIKNILQKFKEIDADLAAQNITLLIETASECDHGAIFIFSTPTAIEFEAKRLTGMKLSCPQKIISKTSVVNTALIKRFASIDGAILSDFYGNCYSYGTILDGSSSPQGDTSRGSRYNSTLTYISTRNDTNNLPAGNVPFIGIVRSEDGMINAFWPTLHI